MIALIVTLALLGAILLIDMIATITAYGSWMTKFPINIEAPVRFNPYNKEIFYIGDVMVYPHAGLKLFTYYHISSYDRGCVPRWSKLHKEIKNTRNKAIQELLLK